MLITLAKELYAIYPSSRFSDIEPLKSMFETTERGVLYNILGAPLYHKIVEDYKNDVDANGGIWADCQTDPDAHIFILRACQQVIVFNALSNTSGILSSSLNQGGGFNQASAQNYDPLDKDVRKDLKLDLYNNALRAVELLLVLLEEDAHNDKRYTELWKQSTYYFFQSKLLIPTAMMMHPYYLDLGKENHHSRFISLIPNIFDAQSLRIETRIGASLMQELLNAENTDNTETTEETEGTENSNETEHTESTEVAEDIESSDETEPEQPVPEPEQPQPLPEQTEHQEQEQQEPTPDPAERRSVILASLTDFRRALAKFVQADITEDKALADGYRHRGDQYLNVAISRFVRRPDLFAEELRTDLDADFRSAHDGKSLTEIEREEEERRQREAEGKRPLPPCPPRRRGLFDLGGLCHK